MFLFKKSLIFVFCILSISLVFSQDKDDLGTEVVNIVKPYTPTISDAFKVKETPVLNDTDSVQKKEVRYEIFSVPVASTFTPSKGKAATVDKAKPITLYDNYATLGFGNYTSVLGELFSSFEISRTDNAGIFFRHNSSQGDIDGVRLENKYYDTELSGNYTSRQKDMSYKLEAGVEHQLFNWYGLNDNFDSATDETLNEIDPQQTYLGFHVGGNISLEESIFEGASAKIHYLGDAFSSSEINLNLQPKFAFPLTDFTLKIDGEVDYVNGSFERNYINNMGIAYSYLNAGITPSLVYVNEDLTLSLGANAVVSLDTENSETEFFIYPQINASYRLVDEVLIVYGGAEGGLHQNTYREFKNENPFVSPTLFIAPTSQLYNAFGGLKGKLSNQVGYNVRGSYGKEENRAFFQLNPYKGMSPNFEGYEYGNSFGLVYDDLNILNIFGELKVEVSNTFMLGASANFYSYSLDNQPEAWNVPELEASIFSNFNITEKVYGGVSLFFVGERKDLDNTSNSQVISLDSFFDANVNLGYRVNDRLSIFAKGSNLLGNNYEKWQNFPVQGIQGLLGATYKFDW
ncbi:TonB-dependent receptor [Aureisphaera sp. CAU 1614]|uniref:TonB-dependent receptor n=1 Tax=Halomarinibacterium sedimenti TaxID=2857106 RepID=A0A9X1JWA7_9FLAO|nr:TonB-dependent receptor [Halomarinibacterium sedimenti]MBW2938899.1 TonB-dependent receptor [Halomarinibacterium sedimenti]